MPLLAYNLTTAPLALAAGSATLPASASAGARSQAMNVTGELKPLTAPDFALLQAQVVAGQVQYEWSGLPEFNTFTLLVGSAQTDVDELPINLFVDAALGDDSNPGTATQPLKTVDGLYDKLPSIARSKFGPNQVTFAAGNYPLTATDYNAPNSNAGARDQSATGFAFIGAQADQLGGPQTTIGGSTVRAYKCMGPVVADDSLRGATLYNLASPGGNASAMVVTNTTVAGVLTINLIANVPIGAGSFKVVRPATVFQVPPDVSPAFTGSIDFIDIKFEALEPAAISDFLIFPLNAFIHFVGCEFDCGASGRNITSLHRARIAGDPGVNRRASFYIHAGSPGAATGFFLNDRTNGNFTIVADNVFINNDGMSPLYTLFLDGRNVDVFVTGMSYGAILGKIDGSLGFVPGAVTAQFGGFIDVIGDLEISNAVNDAVFLDNCNLLVEGGVTLSGTGNAGYGVNCQAGSFATLTASGGAASVTGALGDTLVGAVPKAYGALPYSEVDGSGPTGNMAR